MSEGDSNMLLFITEKGTIRARWFKLVKPLCAAGMEWNRTISPECLTLD